MRFTKRLILITLFALAALLVTGAGYAGDNASLEQHDFDSYFKMDVPKGISFEKRNTTSGNNTNVTLNYRNYTEKINIIYAESIGAKDKMLKYYEDFAKDDENITINTTNNTTLVHFKGDNVIGEYNYHDMAICGDDTKYILMQCDNETLMKSMANSIKFD